MTTLAPGFVCLFVCGVFVVVFLFLIKKVKSVLFISNEAMVLMTVQMMFSSWNTCSEFIPDSSSIFLVT